MLESRVNKLEPSNSTLHSSISSTPLEPPEDHKKREGSSNEPSSSSTQERPAVPITYTYTMGEVEGRLLKRIQTIESQLTQYGTQELPVRQRELETKLNRLLQTNELPSFGHDPASMAFTSLELRIRDMEVHHEELVTENKKLHARVFALEELRTSTKVNHVIDRLDNVIKVVNTQAAENYHLDQSVQDIQQELTLLRQTVDSWNDEQQNDEEEQQENVLAR